jgi:hypothetical protein
MFSGVAFWQSETAVAAGLTYGRFATIKRAGTNQRAGFSNDGITWTAATTPNSLTYTGIDFSPDLGLYVAVAVDTSTSNIMTSTNSVTWTSRTKPTNVALWGVRWIPSFGCFLANSYINIFKSTNGTTWTTAYTFSNTTYQSRAYRPGVGKTNGVDTYVCPAFVTSGNGTFSMIYTTDGTTFGQFIGTSSGWAAGNPSETDYSPIGDNWISSPDGGSPIINNARFLTSTAATSSWGFYTQSAPSANTTKPGITWGKDKWIAPYFVNSGTTTTPVRYSTNGVINSWTNSTFAAALYQFANVAYSRELDLYAISRQDGSTTTYTSTDGITWTSRTGLANMCMSVFGPGVRTTGYKQGAGIT